MRSRRLFLVVVFPGFSCASAPRRLPALMVGGPAFVFRDEEKLSWCWRCCDSHPNHMLCDWQPELTPSESIFRVCVFFLQALIYECAVESLASPTPLGHTLRFLSLFVCTQTVLDGFWPWNKRSNWPVWRLLVELKNPDDLKSINLFCLAHPLILSTPPHPVDLMSFTCAQLTPPLSRSIYNPHPPSSPDPPPLC